MVTDASRGSIDARRAVAVTAAKIASFLTRAAGRGGGTALPGLVATRIDPGLVGDLAGQLGEGSIVVTGTNGKTTTSQMVAAILVEAGRTPLRNRSGSNLMRGVASTLVSRAGVWGNLPHGARLGLFEVDEAALPEVVRTVRPRTLLLLNLFRDQLDRYGEVATVAHVWKETVGVLDPSACVIANADDPLIADVVAHTSARTVFFGVEATAQGRTAVEHASDVKACPRCGGPMEFSVVFLGHQGHYRCTQCDLHRPEPEVKAQDVTLRGLDGSDFRLDSGGTSEEISVGLPGLYNVYNALAAAATASVNGVPSGVVAAGLRGVQAAFGRMERLSVDGRTVQLALAKNPAGLNEVVRTVATSGESLHLLVMLNDNTADGHDVSWIWDADVEMLQGRIASVCFSGRRAADIALRFKYAGLLAGPDAPQCQVTFETEAALRQALDWTPSGGRLFIIPTYTALLDVRGVLARLGHLRQYWEE